MLKEIFTLTKLYIKTALANTKRKNSMKSGKGMLILFIVLGIYFSGLAVFLTVQMCASCDLLNQAQIAAILPIIFVLGFSVFSTILSSVNVLFFSKDNEYILPLPIRVESVVAAKLNNLIFYDYIYALFLGLVPLFTYGVYFKESILFFINSLLVIAITPIIPTVIISFLMIVIMSFSKKAKNKGLFQIIGVLFGICFGFGISLFFQNLDQSKLVVLINESNGLIETYKDSFFILKWSIETLIDYNYLSCLLLLLVNVGIYYLCIKCSKKLFLKGAVGALNSGVSSKHKFKSEDREYSSKGVFVSYVLKEIKSLIRKPIYFTQCVLPTLLIPVLMFVATYFSINIKSDQSGFSTDKLKELMMAESSDKIVFAILCLFVLFTTMFVFVSISAVSRDGENAVFMKYIPVSITKQIYAKAMPDMIMTLLCGVISCLLGLIFLGLKTKIIFYVLIMMIPYSVCHGLLNILIDLNHPKLHWTNELEVCKNNINTLFTICMSLFSCILIVPSFFIGDMSTWAVVYTVIFAIIGRFTMMYIQKKDSSLLDKIF